MWTGQTSCLDLKDKEDVVVAGLLDRRRVWNITLTGNGR